MMRKSFLRAFWTASAGTLAMSAAVGASAFGFLLVVATLVVSFVAWPRAQGLYRPQIADVVMGAMVGGTTGALLGAVLSVVLFGRHGSAAMLLMTYTMAGMVGGTISGWPTWMFR